jgi:hypothetical protein
MRDRGVGERVQENEGARGTEMEGEKRECRRMTGR